MKWQSKIEEQWEKARQFAERDTPPAPTREQCQGYLQCTSFLMAMYGAILAQADRGNAKACAEIARAVIANTLGCDPTREDTLPAEQEVKGETHAG